MTDDAGHADTTQHSAMIPEPKLYLAIFALGSLALSIVGNPMAAPFIVLGVMVFAHALRIGWSMYNE